MTQAVIGPAAVAAAVANPVVINPSQPVQPAGLTDATGEPSMEELAALVPDAVVEPLEEVTGDPTKPQTEETTDVEAAPEKPAEVPSEVDAAAERASKAAAKAREGSRRYAETQRMLQERQQEVQRAAREAEQLRARVQQADALERELKEDPYKALKGRGMTDQQLAERAIRENTPEALTQKLADELRAEREARVALENRLEQQAAQQRQAQARAAAEAKFAKIADDEATYPQLAQLATQAQLDVVKLALARIEANGHDSSRLSDAQVAEAAEKYLAMMRKPGKAAAPAASVAAAKPAAAKPSGVTLTNKQAQTRTVAPANWDDLSDEQQMAHIASALPDPT